MGFEDMPRKMAERNLTVRAERIKEQVRAMPLPERFRVVADLLDAGQRGWAVSVARHALAELESRPDGGRMPQTLAKHEAGSLIGARSCWRVATDSVHSCAQGEARCVSGTFLRDRAAESVTARLPEQPYSHGVRCTTTRLRDTME